MLPWKLWHVAFMWTAPDMHPPPQQLFSPWCQWPPTAVHWVLPHCNNCSRVARWTWQSVGPASRFLETLIWLSIRGTSWNNSDPLKPSCRWDMALTHRVMDTGLLGPYVCPLDTPNRSFESWRVAAWGLHGFDLFQDVPQMPQLGWDLGNLGWHLELFVTFLASFMSSLCCGSTHFPAWGGSRPSESPHTTRGSTWSATKFKWVVPVECQDPRFPNQTLHCNEIIRAINFTCQWF